jgi:mannose-1-phosphate guanylyltransferase
MTNVNKHFYVAIMAGGIGSRFWPYSRTDYPKQFLDILNTGKTLLQWTYERFAQFIPQENIFIVTHQHYVSKVEEQLPDLPTENIVSEPSRKNTAPCIAYISHKIHKQDPQANIVCAPADHLIMDAMSFTQTCLSALMFVQKHSALVTLGIKPTRPDTGYGYIQHETQQVADNVYPVKTFTEKPNLELARTFLQSGDFLWNAGIFVWNVKTILSAFKQYLPEIDELFEQSLPALNTPEEKKIIETIYPQCSNISIDYGIMEKADNVYVIPSNFGWSDLGTWASAYENLERDEAGNAVQGKNIMLVDATNCMIKAPQEKLLVVQGLDEFIVVDTSDVLLICKKENEQQIKEYVAEVKRSKGEKYL